jgi:predicted nucleic acid-binding protein
MPGYLLDTNSIIYFFNGEEKISRLVEKTKDEIFISFITKIEVLCFETTDEHLKKKIDEFLREIEVITIDDDIMALTIEYRKRTGIKIPDSIICATAKVRGLSLVTADKSLTKKLKGLKIISPI